MSAPGFRWSDRREEAALLVARHDLTNEQIASRVGVSRQALDKWKRHPDFASRVASLVEATRRALLARGIADRKAGVAALDDRWRRMMRHLRKCPFSAHFCVPMPTWLLSSEVLSWSQAF